MIVTINLQTMYSAEMVNPETYYFTPTRYVPNSRLPVLVYRAAFSPPYDEATIQVRLEKNKWFKGGTWGPVPRHHFHPNSHECYAILQGSSTLLVGVGPLDDPSTGKTIHVQAGDAIIFPAGVSHCSVDSAGYRYMGVYPKGTPKWKNEYCKDVSRWELTSREAQQVPVPEWDPIHGHLGPLSRLWGDSKLEA